MRREVAGLTALGLAAALAAGCASSPRREGAGTSRERMVRPAVAYEMLRDNPELVVLDVRSFADYQAPTGHLERAVSAPLADLPTLWEVLDLHDEDTVLVYGGADGEDQAIAARLLIERGLRFVVEVEGGLEAWVDRGFAVIVEDAPLSPLHPPASDPR